jgi:tetratricopeptide (TPR) repeat protein
MIGSDRRDPGVAEDVFVHTSADGRVSCWLLDGTDGQFRYWQQVDSPSRPTATAGDGIMVLTPARASRYRQRQGALADAAPGETAEMTVAESATLPTGEVVERCGQDRTDLAFVRAASDEAPLDLQRIRTRWPAAQWIREIEAGLFLVAGIEPAESDDGTDAATLLQCPRARAQQLLTAARASGDRRAVASALTDLGVMSINEGDSQRALDQLKEALLITRALGDAGAEADVTGNFGLLSLNLGNLAGARQLFEQELALARAADDRFAEKAALERLGQTLVRLDDHARALTHFDEALALARATGDRQHEAALLWHQAVAHAGAGRRDLAIATARSAVELARTIDNQQADLLAAHLQKFCDDRADLVIGGAVTVSAGLPDADRQNVGGRGPGILRMGLAAARSVTRFVASGLKTATPDVVRERLQACSTCAHHTGLRCKVCGCFTNVKTRMAQEVCPAGKWPA